MFCGGEKLASLRRELTRGEVGNRFVVSVLGLAVAAAVASSVGWLWGLNCVIGLNIKRAVFSDCPHVLHHIQQSTV